ncbi:hypothetical protein L3V83_11220 [Thiotrichales bacterium 19X7-9]|nr:hypothetical protein [Thiotrichales bacterium 19X7-9]
MLIYENIETNTLKDLYTSLWRKHTYTLTKVFNQLSFPFEVEGLSYTRVFKSGYAIDVPIKFCQQFVDWALSDQAHITGFNSLLASPSVISLSDLDLIQSKEDEKYHLNMITQNELELLPIHSVYNVDYSISCICIFVKKENYLDALLNYQQLNISQLTRKVEEIFLSKENQSFLKDFIVEAIDDEIAQEDQDFFDPKLSILSKAEAACIAAIYYGNFEAKDIADYLCRSVRTVQGLIQSVVQKLDFKNRYELFVDVSQNNKYIKYLYSLDLKLPLASVA